MSNSVPPTHPLPFQPTRHQLDELDALLRRILTLPDHASADDLDSPPPPSEPPVARRIPIRVPELPPRFWSDGTPTSVSVLVSPPPAEYRDAANESHESSEITRTPIVVESAPLPRPRRFSNADWWLRPLLWSNRVFDRAAMRLGRPGRWLRGSRGRAYLGWIGIGCLATAVLWCLADWIGWPW